MADEMTVIVEPTAVINDPGKLETIVVPPTFSGQWSQFGKDMEAIAAETKPAPTQEPQPQASETPGAEVVPPPAPATEPEQPKAPDGQPSAPATLEVKVPDKFKTPEGEVDQERLLKSYLAAEKELKRLQNQAAIPELPPAQPATPQVPETFEAQLERDVKAKGIGPVLAQLFYAARESAYQASVQEIQGFREIHENQARSEELKAIAARDPWVFTQEGLQTLTEVRKNRPWVNASPEPWKEAYRSVLADRALQTGGNGRQVQMLTPKAPTAPAGQAGAASRVTVTPTIRLDSKEAILTHVATLPPEKEAEFWRKLGYKW